ncbi:bifunctional riboflavin kinase/FAD synthetase [Paenibacillus sp. J5C_2022]|uniref:bifunctional riboflavin kinase/FAD synthetase n=1 Tax=Paenibacillus sp. J5C2022 TaxID=2977129 RepID=UPI0021CEA71D|nr:bifunctional riboflavin kinase/FAD synthetase [Paenibacillus sp. J5C2022]MCU6707151.1 bifunctional riboflavin kinase/FAD synthetase [Paenibacillus sp. J5C2022]
MEIIHLTYPMNNAAELGLNAGVSIAIGHFDGVHRGHQNVISEAVKQARRHGLQSAVMTFHPHPREVLGRGEHYYQCLTPLERKTELFRNLGVDIVFVMNFDDRFAAVSPAMFVDDILRGLGVSHAAVGFDFTFGHKGAGTAELLAELGAPNIDVHIVEPLLVKQGLKVSSTYTRESLENGDIATANALLGRPYEVTGTVVHGDGRGRTIGFPTANLQLHHPYVAPRLGVYAVKVWIDGASYNGVLNHGMKPTFNKDEIVPVMEAHVFQFDNDIYGKSITVQFIAFIRSEQKFSSIDELIGQIRSDSKVAEELLEME